MKHNKFVAPVLAGMLSLTLGLAGCDEGYSSSTTITKQETTEAAANDTTNDTANATANETTNETTTEAANETTAQETAGNATVEKDDVICWTGETDKGDTLLYSEDEEEGTASIVLYCNRSGDEDLLAYSGPVKFENSTTTITDSETGEEFSFVVTNATDKVKDVDLGEHGTGTLKPVTEKEFEEEVDDMMQEISAVGEEFQNAYEEGMEELAGILDSIRI